MGIKKKALLAAMGMTLASAPVMAQTAQIERSAATLEDASGQIEASATTYVIAFFVVLAIGLGIYVAVDSGNENRTSP